MKLKLLTLSLALAVAAGVSAFAEDTPSDYPAQIETWHKDRIAHLTRPDGYLSLTGLHWLTESPRTLAGIGEAHLEGKDVVLKFEDGVTLDGKPVTEYRVTPEMPRGTPDFHHGTSHFFVLRHGQKVGIRVKDPNSPTRTNFSGIERFPVQPEWRIVGEFEAAPATIPVPSVVDESTDEGSPGYAVFTWAGQTHKLRLVGEASDPSYFLVFSDASAGKSTYSGCRFLDVEKTPEGNLLLDFNKAENPPCSMTPFATCPLPPEGNVLPFEVEAGERFSGTH